MKHVDRIDGLERTGHPPAAAEPVVPLAEGRT
jgi:hypothetical protein